MNRLKQITTKAKQLYKSGKFAKWTDAIKQASKSIGATKPATKSHKDTKSHNVNIRVVSGFDLKVGDTFRVGDLFYQIIKMDKNGVDYIYKLKNDKAGDVGYRFLQYSNLAFPQIFDKKNKVKSFNFYTQKYTNKKVGAVKIIQKGETVKSKVSKVLQQVRTKKGTFKGYKRIGSVTSDNAKQLILNNIDSTGYGERATTPDEKIRFIEKTFLSEYGWAVARMGKQRAIEEWLRGLPSALTLPFANVDILNLAKQWGALKPNATERAEDKILSNYWKLMASQLLQMMNKRKLNKKFY